MTRPAVVVAARRAEPWQAYLLLAAVPLMLYPLLPAAGRGVVYEAASLATVVACLLAIVLLHPQPRLPWLILLASRVAFLLGDLSWPALAIDDRPFPAIPDAGYLTGYLLTAAAFGLLFVRRSIRRDWNTLLDAGIVTAGLALLSWVAVVDPLLRGAGGAGVDGSDRALIVVYALVNIVLVLVGGCLFAPNTSGGTARLFALGLAALVVAEIVMGFQSAQRPLAGPADIALLANMALWGAAVLHPSAARPPGELRRPDRSLTTRRAAILAASALLAPIVLLATGSNREPLDFVVIPLGWVAIAGLMLTRVVGLVRAQDTALEQQLALESQFREAAELLRAILDASPLGITVVDVNRHLRFWSRGAEQLYGYKADEVIGRFPPMIPYEDLRPFEALIDRVFAGERVTASDLPRVTRDGEPIKVRAYLVPMRDSRGQVWGVMALHEDMRELKQLEAELFEARKMESVGRLAGGIAHDFNNILTAIIGFADLSLADPTGSDVESSLEAIRNSAERAAGLTQQLLAFSRRQMLQPQVIDVNGLVSGVETMLRRLIGEQIALQIVAQPKVGSIRADPTQLQQVILNLAINARDAMPDGGELVIRTGRQTIVSFDSEPEMAPGDYVTITVADSGHGMDEETKVHIFEPFFTTKARGRGTGLGLATTYGIVKQSGGSIHVDSAPGVGTTFVLSFPAVDAAPVEEHAEPARPRRHVGRILLVEDEPVLRDLASRVLSRAGFVVLVAEDPLQAMAIADEHRRDRIDLLLTDVVMPGMRGPELARRLRAVRPELRVLLTSGYADEIVDTDKMEGRFLAKPFSPDELLGAVERALPELVAVY